MNTYLLQILTLALLCGLLEMLVPAGERDGLRRSVRLLAGLCLLCLMLTPLREAREFFSFSDLHLWAEEMEKQTQQDYERLMTEKLTAVTAAQVEEEIYDMLCDRFDLSREMCKVTLAFDSGPERLAVRQVWVSLRGTAVLLDPRQIETAVTAVLDCPCTVSVGP